MGNNCENTCNDASTNPKMQNACKWGCRFWQTYIPDMLGDTRLHAYWDAGSCGPKGNDWDWCNTTAKDCADTVSVDTDVCASGTAKRTRFEENVIFDGCTYAYYAQYICEESGQRSVFDE